MTFFIKKDGKIIDSINAKTKNKARKIYFEKNNLELSEANLSTPLEFFHQRHPRYKDMKLGFSQLPFQNYSCFTCCLAFLVDKDPSEVHSTLKKEKAYSGGLIISSRAAKALGLELLQGNSNIDGRHTDSNYFAKNKQFTTIKEVKLNGNQHFVVRMTDGTIFDPWVGKFLPLNHYVFSSFRLFKN